MRPIEIERERKKAQKKKCIQCANIFVVRFECNAYKFFDLELLLAIFSSTHIEIHTYIRHRFESTASTWHTANELTLLSLFYGNVCTVQLLLLQITHKHTHDGRCLLRNFSCDANKFRVVRSSKIALRFFSTPIRSICVSTHLSCPTNFHIQLGKFTSLHSMNNSCTTFMFISPIPMRNLCHLNANRTQRTSDWKELKVKMKKKELRKDEKKTPKRNKQTR